MAEAPPRTGKKRPESAPDFGVFRGLRAVVAMEPGVGREKLATALTEAGADVVQTNPSGDRLRKAASLDPQIIFVDADGLAAGGPGGSAMAGNGLRLGRALSSNPRLRWAQVVRFSSYGFSEPNPKDPTLVRLAVETKPRVSADAHVKERARRDPPFVVQMARLGPNRLLRALAGVDSPVRLTVCGPRTLAQIDLTGETVAGAVWKEVKPERLALEGLDALAAFLMVEHGEVRIERRDVASLTNLGMSLSDAIREACARIPAVTDMVPRERFADDDEPVETAESESGTARIRFSNIVRPSDVNTDAEFVGGAFSAENELAMDTQVSPSLEASADTVVDVSLDGISDAHTRITAESVLDDQVTRVAEYPTSDALDGARTLKRDATPSQVSLRSMLAPRMRKQSPAEFLPLPPASPERDASYAAAASDAATSAPTPDSLSVATMFPSASPALMAGTVAPTASDMHSPMPRRVTPTLPAASEAATFIAELPLVLGTPKDAIDPSAAYRLRDPMREPTGPLRVREPSSRIARDLGPTAFERMTPTEIVRFQSAAGSVSPPAFRPVHESAWVRFLPAASFVFAGLVVAITVIVIRASTPSPAAPVSSSAPHREAAAAVSATSGAVAPAEVVAPVPAPEVLPTPEPVAKAAPSPSTVVMDPVTVPHPAKVEAEATADESATVPDVALTNEPATADSAEPTATSLLDEADRLNVAGDFTRAEETLLAALRIDAQNGRVVEELARLCLKQHRDLDAVRWAKRAVELSPDGVASNMLLGDALGQSGEMDAARVHWEYADEQREKAKKSTDHEQADAPN